MDLETQLKRFALENGMDLTGVAPIDRFATAPDGHHPEDILPNAKSVVVCARRIPIGVLDGPATAYQRTMEVVHAQLDFAAARVALFLEEHGGRAVPVPADEPYAHWEADRQYGRGDLSHKHAAQAAGLGRLGRNSLLITPRFGNRVHLVSIVTDMDIRFDPMLAWEPCPRGCQLCKKACPVGAIGENQQVDQALCRPQLMERLPKGTVIESCWRCRRVCPAGMKRIKSQADIGNVANLF